MGCLISRMVDDETPFFNHVLGGVQGGFVLSYECFSRCAIILSNSVVRKGAVFRKRTHHLHYVSKSWVLEPFSSIDLEYAFMNVFSEGD